MNIRVARLIIMVSLFVVFLTSCKSLMNSMAFHPDTDNVIATNELLKGIEEFTVVTYDGIKLTSLYLPDIESEFVVLYFHGNAGNIYHRIPDLVQLRKFGLSVVGVSYRGYGKSEGSPSEQGIYLDAEAVYNYVKEELDYATENIFIFGRSIGTTTAVNTAQFKRIAGLILVTPFTSAKAFANTTGMSLLAPLAGDAFNNKLKIKNLKSALLIIHGTQDKMIPQSLGQKLFDSAHQPKKLILIKGATHNNLQSSYARQYWQAVYQFIQSRMIFIDS